MIVDLLIVLSAALAVYVGHDSGFLHRFWASAGLFGGLALARLLQPYALKLVHTTEDRAVVTVVVLLTGAVMGLMIGELIGTHLKRHLLEKRLNRLDNILGSILSVIVILITAWLLAAVSRDLPYSQIRSAIHRSFIIRTLNGLLPPAPQVIDGLGRLINPNGFPDVFIGNEPLPRSRVDLPALGELAAAVNSDRDSVIRIKGQGCGGIVTGSGFVVDHNLVATNAHVIAGIDRPYVQDIKGTRQARVVWFNPQLDMALLEVKDLAGKPLALQADTAAAGTPAAVLGFPGGGDFSAEPAAVLAAYRARGRDIYGQQPTVRDIYELQVTIEQGNSGGPVVDKTGAVIGLVFAESTTQDDVGYALTNDQLRPEIKQAKASMKTVDTGKCTE